MFEVRAFLPIATLLLEVVATFNAPSPTATELSPVVTFAPASLPKNVLFRPSPLSKSFPADVPATVLPSESEVTPPPPPPPEMVIVLVVPVPLAVTPEPTKLIVEAAVDKADPSSCMVIAVPPPALAST